MILKTVIFISKCISRGQGKAELLIYSIQCPEREAKSQDDQEKHKKSKMKKGRRNIEVKFLSPRTSMWQEKKLEASDSKVLQHNNPNEYSLQSYNLLPNITFKCYIPSTL